MKFITYSSLGPELGSFGQCVLVLHDLTACIVQRVMVYAHNQGCGVVIHMNPHWAVTHGLRNFAVDILLLVFYN